MIFFDLDLNPEQNAQAVKVAAEALSNGGLAVMPTDTVYGLCAAVQKPAALRAIYSLKGRGFQKPLPVQLGSYGDLQKILDPKDQRSLWALALAERFWPGPLTIVVPTSYPFDPLLTPRGAVGVRLSDSWPVRSVAAALGGFLAMTSANFSGQPEARRWRDLPAGLLANVDCRIKLDCLERNPPSSVVDLTDFAGATLLRIGQISSADIKACCPLAL